MVFTFKISPLYKSLSSELGAQTLAPDAAVSKQFSQVTLRQAFRHKLSKSEWIETDCRPISGVNRVSVLNVWETGKMWTF